MSSERPDGHSNGHDGGDDHAHDDKAIEADLVRRAQAGDGAAFDSLVDAHVAGISAFLALRAPAPHLVDDLTQETFIVAYDKLSNFTAGTDLGAWLRTIAGHLLRAAVQRFARQRRNQLKLRERLAIERAEQTTGDRGDVLVALEDAMDQLEPNLRELLHMRYRDELDSATIAERLGRSPAWVRTTLFRTRERLRERVQQMLGNDLPASSSQSDQPAVPDADIEAWMTDELDPDQAHDTGELIESDPDLRATAAQHIALDQALGSAATKQE